MAEAILDARNLTRRFGGLVANDAVSLALVRGELHALLGPNGAGKSTLIDLLSGDLAATSGTILYKGSDISHWSADRRSRLGIGRSYQKTNIFPGFTAFENCRLAGQSRLPRVLAVLADAECDSASRDRARRALAQAGLALHSEREAGALSHGEQRQLKFICKILFCM
jgi:branched-chain amino acid transport system ATP-binding protein